LEIFKEIIWTKRALNDLRKAYDFNTEIYGEEKSFAIVQKIISKVELLKDQRFEGIGLIDEDFRHLIYEYRKITVGYLKVNYRVGFDNTTVYINRIFDTRQNPKKNK
jgi:plasmid stabilization system protein ParE